MVALHLIGIVIFGLITGISIVGLYNMEDEDE